VEILCTHIWKWKSETYWNSSRNGGGDYREWWRGWILLWYIVTIFFLYLNFYFLFYCAV
jgi:hypothetical protein